MTVSTLSRRSFFDQFKSPVRQEEVKTRFGKAKRLLHPGVSKELPEAPPSPPSAFFLSGGLTPYAGAWGYEQAAHLLRRTGFGLKKSEVDLLLNLTMDEAVNHVLNVSTAPPPDPVNNYNNPDFTDPDVPEGETWVNAIYNGDAEGFRIESFRAWWLDKMLNQESSALERMTLFWHNHFATQTGEVFYGKVCYRHNAMLRAHALGNFKAMTKAVTLDAMMLFYLNGYLNGAGSPDENYARELQELFTIGKEDGQPFTEDDVVQAAKVLTGWRINFEEGTSFYSVLEHDFTNKQFSAFYNNAVIVGNPNAEVELDALLDMIFAKDEVAVHLARKFYRWFVYYNIDDNAEQNVIQPLAQIFRDNDYEIKPVLAALLKSEHFFEAVNSGCFIKTPVDVVIGTLRSFNLSVPASTPWDGLVMHYIQGLMMANMQMLPGDPPNVAGWQAFRQSPQFYRIWINGDTARNRNFYTDVLTAFYFETDNDQLNIDHIAFVSQFDNPQDPVALIEDEIKLLLPQPLSASKKFLLKSVLLSGLPNDAYWTAAWFAYQADPTDEMAFQAVNVRLTILHNYILKLPEYQLA